MKNSFVHENLYNTQSVKEFLMPKTAAIKPRKHPRLENFSGFIAQNAPDKKTNKNAIFMYIKSVLESILI
ncbi:MAG: hypothetical protein LBD84_03350 [Campylobacteraceae bacterium]|nr:hypothetical protein [Campylobacteraceae bacterium]